MTAASKARPSLGNAVKLSAVHVGGEAQGAATWRDASASWAHATFSLSHHRHSGSRAGRRIFQARSWAMTARYLAIMALDALRGLR